MKIIKNITTSFLTAILTMSFVYGGYTIYAQGAEDIADPSEGFDVVMSSYHETMNDFFNSKLEKLVDMIDEDEEDFLRNPNFNAPEDAAQCTEDNVSTYCVSLQALDIYIEYLYTLEALKSQLVYTNPNEELTLGDLIAGADLRDEDIESEVNEAKQVMEATIAAYDEFRRAYPMHRKFEDIIENLIKYKLLLKDVRRETMRMPEKFIDASTVYCE